MQKHVFVNNKHASVLKNKLKPRFPLLVILTDRSAQDHDHEEAGKEDHHEEDQEVDGLFASGA